MSIIPQFQDASPTSGPIDVRSSEIGLESLWHNQNALPNLNNRKLFFEYFFRACKNISRAPFTFFASILSVAIALFVLEFLLLVAHNANVQLVKAGSSQVMSVYLLDSITDDEKELIKESIEQDAITSSVAFKNKSEAFREFKEELAEDAFILDGLSGKLNPLPSSFEVEFNLISNFSEELGAFTQRLHSFDKVERVIYGSGLFSKASSFYQTIKRVGAGCVFVLFIVVAFMIGNAVRLGLYSHREEIEIMRLVGASPKYIRGPYLIEGALQGFAGVVLSVLFLFITVFIVTELVKLSDTLGLVVSSIVFLPFWIVTIVSLASVGMGIAASYLSVGRFLRED